MRLALAANDPITLTYYHLRKAVGIVAFAHPFALAIPWWFLCNHALEPSISYYYYTGMRNLFVGSLCAIAMFMLCCQGYDCWDTYAGIFSALCAIGVAFCPTTPDGTTTQFQSIIGKIHWTFAALLFLTLACFCLFLFTMSAQGRTLTPRKKQRNRLYVTCGCVIIASMLMIAVLKSLDIKYLWGIIGSDFLFETAALLAFGAAWLVKGETFLKDDPPAPPPAGQPVAIA